MKNALETTNPMSRIALWFGMLGGAVAWSLHLLAAYLIAEFGCVASFARHDFLGVTAVAWLIGIVSLLMLAVAVAATLAAYRAGRDLRTPGTSIGRATDAYLARLGLLTSGLFVLIIAFQTLPIFFYLRHC